MIEHYMLKTLTSTAKELSWYAVDMPASHLNYLDGNYFILNKEVIDWLITNLGSNGTSWFLLFDTEALTEDNEVVRTCSTQILFKRREDAVWFKTVW
ncbi:MAG: hypothetical protein HC836_26160 [Richelia sp. RM2_1_2]|nr:hypothetical protein [Richelia sp. RM2_1_2]